jgi:hypothetical protein
MDEQYMIKIATSFLHELTEIEKKGFAPLRFIGSGLKMLGGALTKKVAPELAGKGGWGMASRLGGPGAVRAGGLGKHIKQIYGAGAAKATGAGNNGVLGGLGALGRSRYGQMAGAAAVPIAAGYGLSKAAE